MEERGRRNFSDKGHLAFGNSINFSLGTSSANVMVCVVIGICWSAPCKVDVEEIDSSGKSLESSGKGLEAPGSSTTATIMMGR